MRKKRFLLKFTGEYLLDMLVDNSKKEHELLGVKHSLDTDTYTFVFNSSAEEVEQISEGEKCPLLPHLHYNKTNGL